MPARKKINLEKVKASLATPCPHCGYQIPPGGTAPHQYDSKALPEVWSHFHHKRDGGLKSRNWGTGWARNSIHK
jgi:hypothetical protein